MIMQYCVDTKQSAVGYNYILTVAKNWANEGITSTLQVEQRLQKFQEKSPEMCEIFNLVGIKRSPYVEERSLLNKWLNDYGFTIDVILHICKSFKGKNRFSFEKTDKILSKYYEMKLFSIQEIDSYECQKQELYTLAKDINKALGLYYENLENIVESYILKWINMGFDNNLLLDIANYCFKSSIRTLEGMDKSVTKFYKLGLLSVDAFNEYMGNIISIDEKIQLLLDKMDVCRVVNFIDRENYKTWTENWNMGENIIEYAASIAKGKDNPVKYLSKVLADYHEKGIKTLDEAKKTSPVEYVKENKKNFKGRSYSSTQLNALFQSIDEVDV